MGRRARRAVVVAAGAAAVLVGATASSGAAGSVELYVSDWSGGTIERIDPDGGTVGTGLPVGQGVIDLAITTSGRTAYAVSAIRNAVVAIDLDTSTVEATIPVPCATSIALVPGRQKAYVSQSCGTTVTPLDLSTNTAGAPITVGPGGFGLAATPGGEIVYVATGGSGLGDALTPIDVGSDTAGTPISLGSSGAPASVVVTPDGGTAFVAMERGDSVIPVDLRTGVTGAPIAVSTNPVGLALTPDGTRLFVTHYQRGPSGLGDPIPADVTPVDVATRTALPDIVLGSQTADVAVTADGTRAYVTVVADSDTPAEVVPIDVATLSAGTPIPVPGEPIALAIRPPVDAVPPTLAPTVAGSGPGGAVLLHDPSALARPNADDGVGSGLASSSCGTPDVSTVGLHTLACTATDLAGNTATADATYVVQYRLVGLTPAAGTVARAGKPLKLAVSLADANGNPAALCSGCAVDVQTVSVGSGQSDGPFAMTFHNGSGEYRYTWKPPAAALGATRIVVSVRYPGTSVTTTSESLITIT